MEEVKGAGDKVVVVITFESYTTRTAISWGKTIML